MLFDHHPLRIRKKKKREKYLYDRSFDVLETEK